MAGYNNYSMSNNACAAYENGERPISKWLKSDILSMCGEKADIAKKLNANEIKAELLRRSSWHHTSSMYNRTDFYRFDDEALDRLTEERVQQIISARPAKEVSSANVEEKIVTAEITYTLWLGTAKHKRPKKITETVQMRKTDKMVETANGNKRVACLESIRFLED